MVKCFFGKELLANCFNFRLGQQLPLAQLPRTAQIWFTFRTSSSIPNLNSLFKKFDRVRPLLRRKNPISFDNKPKPFSSKSTSCLSNDQKSKRCSPTSYMLWFDSKEVRFLCSSKNTNIALIHHWTGFQFKSPLLCILMPLSSKAEEKHPILMI